jgi:hypothetical protein
VRRRRRLARSFGGGHRCLTADLLGKGNGRRPGVSLPASALPALHGLAIMSQRLRANPRAIDRPRLAPAVAVDGPGHHRHVR